MTVGVQRLIHRNGVVEFDDPDTGMHVVMMDGLTVESSDNDALAIVSVAAIVTCSACFKRWISPVADYRQGWSTCRHCNARLFLPPLYGAGDGKSSDATSGKPVCGHEFPVPEDEG